MAARQARKPRELCGPESAQSRVRHQLPGFQIGFRKPYGCPHDNRRRFFKFLLLSYDLFVNSFSELLRMAPVIQLVLFIIQDIAILFNIIIIFLMFFNTFVFQAGLVNLLFHKFKGTIILTSLYFALSISFHVWVMNLRWKNSNSFIWTDGLQTIFVLQRLAAVLYCYFYKRTAMRLGDPRFYQDSLWLRKEFMQVRR